MPKSFYRTGSRPSSARPGSRPPGNFPWLDYNPHTCGIPGSRCGSNSHFERYGYFGGYDYTGLAPRSSSNWHGIPGVWEMMPGEGGSRSDSEDI
jgi:hypothetical protein